MHRVIVFNVQHGFCAFAKSPTGSTLMIDCGKSEEFSAVQYVYNQELDASAFQDRYRITELIITHPHDDHIEDISSVTTWLEPRILLRQKYNWEAIKSPGADGKEYENLDDYAGWQQTYSEPVILQPNWGMTIDTFRLTPQQAYLLDKTKYINNSSIVTVLTIKGSQYTEKFLFGGDVEQAGWEALLEKPSFLQAIKDVDFYITPHHGHTSGFSAGVFDAMGRRPFVNIVSVHSRDENVDSRYSKDDFAIGLEIAGESRYMLSTRSDGSIFIDVDPSGRFTLFTYDLPPNLGP